MRECETLVYIGEAGRDGLQSLRVATCWVVEAGGVYEEGSQVGDSVDLYLCSTFLRG